ncbi:MAG: hypothetical protein ABW067_17405 [Rhizobacter sp.]
MNLLQILLYFAAAILFGLAAFRPATAPRVHLGWLGACVFAIAVVLPPILTST